MKWDLSRIRSRVRKLTGRTSETRLPQSELDDEINNYYQNHLPDVLNPSELQTFFTLLTAAGEGEYGIDPSMRAVFPPVWIGGSQALYTDDHGWFFNSYPDRYSQKQQKPEAVLLYDRTFWLAPIPDAGYEIKVSALYRPEPLELDGDAPVDQQWGEAVAAGAAIEILRNKGDHQEAQALDPFLDYHLGQIRRTNLLSWQGKRPAPQF